MPGQKACTVLGMYFGTILVDSAFTVCGVEFELVGETHFCVRLLSPSLSFLAPALPLDGAELPEIG